MPAEPVFSTIASMTPALPVATLAQGSGWPRILATSTEPTASRTIVSSETLSEVTGAAFADPLALVRSSLKVSALSMPPETQPERQRTAKMQAPICEFLLASLKTAKASNVVPFNSMSRACPLFLESRKRSIPLSLRNSGRETAARFPWNCSRGGSVLVLRRKVDFKHAARAVATANLDDEIDGALGICYYLAMR